MVFHARIRFNTFWTDRHDRCVRVNPVLCNYELSASPNKWEIIKDLGSKTAGLGSRILHNHNTQLVNLASRKGSKETLQPLGSWSVTAELKLICLTLTAALLQMTLQSKPLYQNFYWKRTNHEKKCKKNCKKKTQIHFTEIWLQREQLDGINLHSVVRAGLMTACWGSDRVQMMLPSWFHCQAQFLVSVKQGSSSGDMTLNMCTNTILHYKLSLPYVRVWFAAFQLRNFASCNGNKSPTELYEKH